MNSPGTGKLPDNAIDPHRLWPVCALKAYTVRANPKSVSSGVHPYFSVDTVTQFG